MGDDEEGGRLEAVTVKSPKRRKREEEKWRTVSPAMLQSSVSIMSALQVKHKVWRHSASFLDLLQRHESI